jgi:hypothetical protein
MLFYLDVNTMVSHNLVLASTFLIMQVLVKRPGYDVWGKSYTVNNLPSYDCVNCQKTIASTRYAPHLEKCLGLSGRQSSRVASRRMGGNSPSFSSDDNMMTPDDDRLHSPGLINKKKKVQQQSVSLTVDCLKFDCSLFYC